MTIQEIREKNVADLSQLETKLRKDLALAKLQARGGQFANISKIRSMKKDIARILTVKKVKVMESKKVVA